MENSHILLYRNIDFKEFKFTVNAVVTTLYKGYNGLMRITESVGIT